LICQWLASLPTSGKGAKRLFVSKDANKEQNCCQWLASLPNSDKGAKRLFVGKNANKEQNRKSCSTNNLSQKVAVYIYILAIFLLLN
jgi:hypothetical protein